MTTKPAAIHYVLTPDARFAVKPCGRDVYALKRTTDPRKVSCQTCSQHRDVRRARTQQAEDERRRKSGVRRVVAECVDLLASTAPARLVVTLGALALLPVSELARPIRRKLELRSTNRDIARLGFIGGGKLRPAGEIEIRIRKGE